MRYLKVPPVVKGLMDMCCSLDSDNNSLNRCHYSFGMVEIFRTVYRMRQHLVTQAPTEGSFLPNPRETSGGGCKPSKFLILSDATVESCSWVLQCDGRYLNFGRCRFLLIILQYNVGVKYTMRGNKLKFTGTQRVFFAVRVGLITPISLNILITGI